MLIFDAHLDLSWNALQWNRDLSQSVLTLRTQEAAVSGRAQNTVAYPEMKAGRVAFCFATLLARSTGKARPHTDFGSPAQAYGITQGQLAYYRALASIGHISIIDDVSTLETHLSAWRAWETRGGNLEDAPP